MKHRILSFLFLVISFTTHAQWQQTSGPETGAVLCYTSSTSFLYCGTYGAGVFRSADNGVNWVPVNNGMGSAYISGIAYNNGYLIAGTSNGVYVSTDEGNSWTQKNNGLTATGVSKVISAGNHTFIAISGGLWLSTDYGDNWTLTNYGAGPTAYVSGLFFKGSYLFCSSSTSGVSRSSDFGTSWTTVNTGLPSTSTRGMGTDGNVIFLSTYTDRVYKSVDDGSSWTASFTGISSGAVLYSFAFNGNTIIAGGNSGVLKSTDYGTNWVESNDSMNRAVEAVYKVGNRFFAGNYEHTVFYNYRGGNYYSDDFGVTWSRANSGLINSNIIEIKIDGDLIIAGSEGGTFISHNHGDTWSEVSYSNPNYFRRDAARSIEISDSLIFIGTIENEVFRSLDRGQTWSYSGVGMSGENVSCIKIFGTKVLATTENGVNRSNNNGANWAISNTGINGVTCSTIGYMGNNLLVGTSAGLYLSTDSGTVWTALSNSLSGKQIFGLHSNGSKLFATTNAGLFSSIDSGLTWQSLNPSIRRIAFWNNVLYSAGQFSLDDGITWTTLPAIITPFNLAPYVPSIAVDSNYFYFGMLHLGVWRLSTTGLIAVKELDNPLAFKVYPNPASQDLTLQLNETIEEVELVSMIGETVLNWKGCSGTCILNVSQLSKGQYAVRVRTISGWRTSNVIIQ